MFYCPHRPLADLGGREGRTPPPGRPNSFDFMQFSGKFGVFTPPLEGSRPPPRENPGSATADDIYRLCCPTSDIFREHNGNYLTALFTKPLDGLPPYRTGSGGRSVRRFPIDIFPFCRERPVTKEPVAL